jgi:hypothetical protein
MKRFWRDNSLTIVLSLMSLVFIVGQALTGLSQHNEDLQRHGRQPLVISQYLVSGHFVEAIFENWESEFFQMGLYVLFTAFLYQRGSSESKRSANEENHPIQKQIDALKEQLKQERIAQYGKPWPIKKGGVWKKLYSYSFAIALFSLFGLSLVLHALGGWKQENIERSFYGEGPQSFWSFVGSSDFWFQSFQNWQSEFLSMAVLIVMSIYLRQKNSSQSKDLDAPHAMTGD